MALKATIGPADPNRKPNNPFYLAASKLAKAKNTKGLKALDERLAEAGYAASGQVRRFIADALAANGEKGAK